MTKLHWRKPTHKQALIIFWSLVGLMLTSWVIVFTNQYHDLLTDANMPLGYFVFVANLSFLPVMFLIPLIGGGHFKPKEIVN